MVRKEERFEYFPDQEPPEIYEQTYQELDERLKLHVDVMGLERVAVGEPGEISLLARDRPQDPLEPVTTVNIFIGRDSAPAQENPNFFETYAIVGRTDARKPLPDALFPEMTILRIVSDSTRPGENVVTHIQLPRFP